MKKFAAWWVVVVWVLLAAGGVARGQLVTGEIVSVGIEGESGGASGARGMYRLGHWVPVRVKLENRSGTRLGVYLGVEQGDMDGDKVRSCGRTEVLEPSLEARDVWFYYWPRPDEASDSQVKEVVVFDSEKRTEISKIKMGGGGGAGGGGGIPIHPQPGDDDHSPRFVVVVGPKMMGLGNFRGAKGGTATNRFGWVQNANQLPDNVLGLDGVDVIVWNPEGERVHVSDMPAEFQLKAILEWVRAGGHLIMTVGDRWQEMAGSEKLAAALPVTLTGTRELKDAEVLEKFVERGADGWGQRIRGPFVQVTGKLKPGARWVTARNANSQLVATGMYGAGAVTVVTMDMASSRLDTPMRPDQWLDFWQRVAGWKGEVWTKGAWDAITKTPKAEDLLTSPPVARLDGGVSAAVDLSKQTVVRLLLAVLFLGLYWVAAGPGGHFVLRYYKVTHWSWWIFGATVLAASAGAVVVVSVFRLENYELKHRTYVMGVAGSPEASVLAYYGVFAPVDGAVTMALPENGGAAGGRGGLAYLAPLNEPTEGPVKSFADPQHYEMSNGRAWEAAMPFRSTLKKVEARWVGPVKGIRASGVRMHLEAGAREKDGVSQHLALAGELVNQTGYDLKNVRVVAVAAEGETVFDGPLPTLDYYNAIFDIVGDWKTGTTVALNDARVKLRDRGLGEILQRVGRHSGGRGALGGPMALSGETTIDSQVAAQDGNPTELLNVLLEARPMESLWKSSGGKWTTSSGGRTEFVRCLTRLVDRSKSLRATRVLVIAHAGDAKDGGVRAPVPLKVNGRELPGSGEIVFTWAVLTE